jgi:hypothetical protein
LINFSLSSTDPYFNGTPCPPVVAYVTDNDLPGISIVESSGTTSTTEGSTAQDSFTVVLTKQPLGDVDVLVQGGTQSLLSKSGTPNLASVTLNFTPANWSTAQTVNVLPVNDVIPELRHLADITLSITPTSSAEYADLPAESLPKVVHIITDNDNNVAGNVVRITESSSTTSVTESGATVNGVTSSSDTVTLVLSQQPTAPVTITFTPDSQLAVSPSSITFIPGATGAGTFNVAQTVTIRSLDDSLMEPILHWGKVTATVVSDDPVFHQAAVTPITSSVYDNDGPSVTIQPSGGSTILTEAGRTDTYTIRISHAPVSDVTILIQPDAQLTADVSSVVFTPANWAAPRTITLTAVDDSAAESANHSGLVSHTILSTDRSYQGISAATLTAQVWDNDSPGLAVSHAGSDPTSTIVTEGGTHDTIILRLTQAPAPGTSVTVTLYPPAFYVPPPQHGKVAGYFVSDQGGSNQRDNIVIDYTESILKYRETFYASLRAQNGGVIPATPATAQVQNAHWAASRAIIDQMDLWLNGGAMKARHPVLIEPNQPPPSPLPPPNPRQAIIEAIYAHSGGDNLPATTRYEAEIPFNPKNPSTTTFANEVRDRVRWAGYLMAVGAPGLVAH